MKQTPILRLIKIVKRYGKFTAVRGVDLEIFNGEFLTIVGPSGSGKSTLIRLLVGMDEVSEGEILLYDEKINDKPANLRPTCMVFQSLALFPHMSVGQNIEFPLKLQKINPNQRKSKAMELMEMLQLPNSFYDKRISQCSGGEKQRIALARALAFDPEILFFDEPLSALDYRLRRQLEKELKNLHQQTGKTFVYITHSLEEAMVMSDRIAIMRSGEFVQIADAEEIYARPNSKFVANFMGEVNLFDVELDLAGEIKCPAIKINENTVIQPLKEKLATCKSGAIMVRPENTRFLQENETVDFTISGSLIGVYSLGSRIQYEIKTESSEIVTIEKLREDQFLGNEGDSVSIGFDMESIHLIQGAD